MRARFLILVAMGATLLSAQTKKGSKETAEDYFKRWLEVDVEYIITEEERAVFKKLGTTEEKEQFIEQFWRRRDPNPETSENEFRTEHYRRFAYANEKFAFGRPGWMSDRGRVYIALGPPDEIEQHPSGGIYDRRPSEGGGYTATYPFERWFYRHIEGVGDGIELEFVDPSWTGEYRLAFSPEEKDAHLHVAGAGPTLYEMMGFTKRWERPYFKPGVLGTQAHQYGFQILSKDNPFQRLEVLTNLQRPPQIKFKDLEQAVAARVTYDLVPFDYASTYVRASADRLLAPVTVLVDNKDLSFKGEAGLYRAELNIFGQVTDLTGRRAAVFEDSMVAEFGEPQLERARALKSIYQRPLLLPSGRYKLSLVLKDVHSGRLGSADAALVLPRLVEGRLATSPIILSERLEPARPEEPVGSPFVLGRLKVVPKLDRGFSPPNPLGIYFEIYNPLIDQRTARPEVDVALTVLREGKAVETKDLFVWQYFDGDRILYAKGISTENLPPGRYEVRSVVTDRVASTSTEAASHFEIR